MGWGTLNLISTIGAFVLALGILLIVVERDLVAVAAGAPAGDDPWGANTLEWATTSPPPAYNFASIPVVRSAEPELGRRDARGDRAASARRARAADGHETVATTELDGDLDEVLRDARRLAVAARAGGAIAASSSSG